MSGAHSCALPGCDLEGEVYTFVDPGSRIVHVPVVCRMCKGTDELIVGDGERVICLGCVALFGKFVTHPEQVGPGLLDDLLTVHGDVVDLEHLPGGGLRWAWAADWPGVR